jgi:hypothetical protein
LISLEVTPGSAACAGSEEKTNAPTVTATEAIDKRFMRVFLIIYFLP